MEYAVWKDGKWVSASKAVASNSAGSEKNPRFVKTHKAVHTRQQKPTAPEIAGPGEYILEHDLGVAGDPKDAMGLMQTDPNAVFPFEVEGVEGTPDRIVQDGQYSLNNIIPGARWGVQVSDVTSTSFSFTVLPGTGLDGSGHVDPVGSVITFSMYSGKNGNIFLRQHGVPNHGSSGLTTNLTTKITTNRAIATWKTQADTLRQLLLNQ